MCATSVPYYVTFCDARRLDGLCDFISRYCAQLIANRSLYRYSWRSDNVVRPWMENLRRQSNDPNRFIVRNNSRDVYAASASLRLPARGWKWRDLWERIGARNASESIDSLFVAIFFFPLYRLDRYKSRVPVHARVKREYAQRDNEGFAFAIWLWICRSFANRIGTNYIVK